MINSMLTHVPFWLLNIFLNEIKVHNKHKTRICVLGCFDSQHFQEKLIKIKCFEHHIDVLKIRCMEKLNQPLNVKKIKRENKRIF